MSERIFVSYSFIFSLACAFLLFPVIQPLHQLHQVSEMAVLEPIIRRRGAYLARETRRRTQHERERVNVTDHLGLVGHRHKQPAEKEGWEVLVRI